MPRDGAGPALPHWPRMLNKHLAAAYLGTTVAGLERLGLPSVLLSGRRVWDRNVLDGYADALRSGVGPSTDRDHWLQQVRDADAAEAR